MAGDLSKSEFLLACFKAIIADAKQAFPTMCEDLERDLERIELTVRLLGISTLLVDLPALAKHLDRCLAEGLYQASGLALSGVGSKRNVTPAFLGCLYLEIFEPSGRLRTDYNVEAILFLRQILYLAKKFRLACSPADVAAEVAAFRAVEAELPMPHIVWQKELPETQDFIHAYEGGFSSQRFSKEAVGQKISGAKAKRFLKILDIVSGILASGLGHYDPTDWKHRHGPGAVAERSGAFNRYELQNWSDRLDSAFPMSDHAYHDYMAWAADRSRREGVDSVDYPSRMIAVPKTLRKPRLIASEESSHIWCQQNLRHFLSSRFSDGKRVFHWFIHLEDQSYNRSLARKASSDGLSATVDLSAASDRITCDVIGCLFRANPGILRALHACRTRSMSISGDLSGSEGDEIIELKKFSTMGSAVTFPVETLWFLAVALASCIYAKGLKPTRKSLRKLKGKVAVFGDDIVVPTDSVETLLWGLELTYSKPNAEKSYWTGMFRESCGLDCFAGVDVSPVYVNQVPYECKPESIMGTLDTRNNFFAKYMLNVSGYLEWTLTRTGHRFAAKAMRSAAVGLAYRTFPFSAEHPHWGARWNRNLQRYETSSVTLVATEERHAINDDSALLQFFTEAPEPSTEWASGWRERPSLKLRRRWAPCCSFLATE